MVVAMLPALCVRGGGGGRGEGEKREWERVNRARPPRVPAARGAAAPPAPLRPGVTRRAENAPQAAFRWPRAPF